MQRPAELARLISAFDAGTGCALSHHNTKVSAAIRRMCSALRKPSGDVADTGRGQTQALPACSHLDAALANVCKGRAATPELTELADAFRAIAPLLCWHISNRAGTVAFASGHANTEIVGPSGIERRSDVVLGASLLAPDVAYPFHSHPPEEIYMVMSDGDWFRDEAGWYTPGMGGIVHHPPGVTHAMRSGAVPLLALWCLRTGSQ